MIRWKDYGLYSRCFIDGIDISLASIKIKNMELIETLTGNKTKLKADDLNAAKVSAEKILIEFWKTCYKEIGIILDLLNK